MDKQLLKALGNLSDSLEYIAEILASKDDSKSATGTALKSGDFGKSLEAINVSIKSIKSDTEEILKNQNTILTQSKSKENDKLKGAEVDKKQEDKIKNGVGTILLIAVGVLAIGLAFKLVGDIQILSVITLALGITLVAIAFEKVAKLDISIKQAAVVSLTMVMMATAITISSWIMGLIKPIGLGQMITAVMIGAGFALLGDSISKLITSISKIGISTLIKSVLFLPLILPAIALSIALASHAFGLVKPISFGQFIASLLISGIFVVVSLGLRNILQAFKGIPESSLVKAAIFLPLILPAMALSMALASDFIGMIKPITIGQFFSALLVSIIFVALSFSIKNIMKSFSGMNPGQMITASLMIPVLLPAMAAAIWGSSIFLNKVEDITFGQFVTALTISILFVVLSFGIRMIADGIKSMKWGDVPKIPVFFTLMSMAITASSFILSQAVIIEYSDMLKIGLMGVVLSAIAIGMGFALKGLGKIGMKELFVGSLAIVVLAGAIMISSHILAVGNYENYPSMEWIGGVSLSLLAFGLGAFALGMFVFGPQALIFGAGLLAIVAVSGTILAVSKVLSKGKYDNPGMFEWAKSTSLLYATFTPIIMALGAMGIGGAIVEFFGGDNPFDVAKGMMIQIAETIVAVSHKLGEGNYSGGPTENWAKGIAISMGAFMPIYRMLVANKIMSIFGSGGVGPEDFTRAINTVIDGILVAADKLANSKGVFKNGPDPKWAEGVGKALGAFSPVFQMLSGKSWLSSSDSVIESMSKGISVITEAIILSGEKFSKSNPNWWKLENVPSKEWGEGVGSVIGAYSKMIKDLKIDEDSVDDVSYIITKITRSISKTAHILYNNRKYFNSDMNPDFIKNISSNIIEYSKLADYLVKSKDENTSTIGKIGSAFGITQDPIVGVAKSMGILAKAYDKISKSFTNVGKSLQTINLDTLREVKSLQNGGLPSDDIEKVNGTNDGIWSKIGFGGDSQSPSVSNKTKGKEDIYDKHKFGLDGKTMPEQLDILIGLLKNIDGSTNKIDEYISSMDDSIINTPPTL